MKASWILGALSLLALSVALSALWIERGTVERSFTKQPDHTGMVPVAHGDGSGITWEPASTLERSHSGPADWSKQNACIGADQCGLTRDTSLCVGSGCTEPVLSGSDNTMVGLRAGTNLSSGSRNLCIGNDSCPDLTTGNDNVCIGRFSCKGVTTQSHVIDVPKGMSHQAALDFACVLRYAMTAMTSPDSAMRDCDTGKRPVMDTALGWRSGACLRINDKPCF